LGQGFSLVLIFSLSLCTVANQGVKERELMKPTIGWGVLAVFLLHPNPSATAPRTVASAASGWINIGGDGTRFHKTPQAL
jgi:hypothetical protein